MLLYWGPAGMSIAVNTSQGGGSLGCDMRQRSSTGGSQFGSAWGGERDGCANSSEPHPPLPYAATVCPVHISILACLIPFLLLSLFCRFFSKLSCRKVCQRTTPSIAKWRVTRLHSPQFCSSHRIICSKLGLHSSCLPLLQKPFGHCIILCIVLCSIFVPHLH
jgi:hypothetical protein